jgi:hypothetical protein
MVLTGRTPGTAGSTSGRQPDVKLTKIAKTNNMTRQTIDIFRLAIEVQVKRVLVQT